MNSFAIVMTTAAIGLMITCLAQFAVFRKKRQALLAQIDQASENHLLAEQKCSELEKRFAQSKAFQRNLAEADLSKRLQNPQQTANNPKHNSTPERYQYASSLIHQGMKAEELSRVLSLSLEEARQLVALASINKTS